MIPPLALKRSQQTSAACDVMLVIGTSATVQPAAMMPVIAKRAGATVIEFNEEETPLSQWVSDYRVPGKAGEVMAEVVAKVEELRAGT
jgi:NAD-dependent deacetylase